MGFGKSTFEIKKGASGDVEDEEEEGPLGPITLPVSMTGQAETESLKNRFGVDELPDIDKHHANVLLTESAGAGGLERSHKATIITVLLILVVGGAALLYFGGIIPGR